MMMTTYKTGGRGGMTEGEAIEAAETARGSFGRNPVIVRETDGRKMMVSYKGGKYNFNTGKVEGLVFFLEET
jgi:hypothetical protein